MDNKNIDDIVKAEKRAYFKQWRANNKDKVKKHNATYWQKRAENSNLYKGGDV